MNLKLNLSCHHGIDVSIATYVCQRHAIKGPLIVDDLLHSYWSKASVQLFETDSLSK